MGTNEEIVDLFRQKKRTGMVARFRSQILPPLADHEIPTWAHWKFRPLISNISYNAAPRKKSPKSLEEVDPEVLKTVDKLGIPLEETKCAFRYGRNAVMDSISVKKPLQRKSGRMGIIFVIQRSRATYPDLVQKYMGRLFLIRQFFATLNSAVCSMALLCTFKKCTCPRNFLLIFVSTVQYRAVGRTQSSPTKTVYFLISKNCTAFPCAMKITSCRLVEIIGSKC
jgi:Fe-S cluster assembly protein SufB